MLMGTGVCRGVLWGVLGCLLAGASGPAPAAPDDRIVIVANRFYPASSLTRSETREIYLGLRTIEQFLRIRPIDQSDPAIRAAFLQTVLNLSRETYIDHWNRLLFQQGGLPPLLKDSPDEVVQELLKTDGAIGYLWGRDAEGRNGLKILLVIPVRPSTAPGERPPPALPPN
ncbi:MAG: hypothetical protein HY208_08755 [Nitrospirae bacterium]|nr:hypothetical protein [Nitrospirota bacterium]